MTAVRVPLRRVKGSIEDGSRGWTTRIPRSTLFRIETSSAGFVVAGKAWRGLGVPTPQYERSDSFVVGLDGSGAQLWSDRLVGDSPTQGENTATDVAVSPDGTTAYVSSIVSGLLDTDEDIAVVAYDIATGVRLWVAESATPGHLGEFPTAIEASDSGVFITGASGARPRDARALSDTMVYAPLPYLPGPSEAVALSLAPDTGEIRWTARSDPGSVGGAAMGWAIALTDQRVLIAGFDAREVGGLVDGNMADGFAAAYAL
jgi:outer membrane protein assembly factor BamB